MRYNRILSSLCGQIEADGVLGARWLPMSPLSPSAAKPGAKTVASAGSKVAAGSAARPAAAPMTKPMAAPANQTPINQPASTQTVSNMATKPKTKPSAGDDQATQERIAKLAEIARAVAKCSGCHLNKLRKNPVPGQGNPNARIVFVGEAPGESEDEQGLAFVGRAGKLLTNIIEAMGLKRDDVYICNILKCRPPGNRDPQGEEIVACIEYLYKQLDIIDPEIIVALGAHAARTLLGSPAPIGQLRGMVHQYLPHPLAKPIKLVATYHPAYLLRSYTPDNRLRVWNDMQLVLKELGLPIPKKSSGVSQ